MRDFDRGVAVGIGIGVQIAISLIVIGFAVAHIVGAA